LIVITVTMASKPEAASEYINLLKQYTISLSSYLFAPP